MVQFDPELWRTRAWTRYQRAQTRDFDRASERHLVETDSISALEVLIGWCESRGLKVEFNCEPNGTYNPEDGLIEINCHLLPEKQLHLALHECGHHLIGKKYDKERAAAKAPFHHRCDALDEEFDAWKRGFRLGGRLKLRVNKPRYDATRTEMIKSYMRWALTARGQTGDSED